MMFLVLTNMKKIVRKQRTFSPIYWIRNIKLFNDENIKKRKGIDDKSKLDWQNTQTLNKNEDLVLNFDPQQLLMMTKIHDQIITKTSYLVRNAKNSKFAGFFSPIRLRNRIKRGDFNRIAWSPQIFDRSGIKTWNQTSIRDKNLKYLNSENSSEDPNKFWSFNNQDKASERGIFNIDSVDKSIKSKFSRKNRLKEISRRYQYFKNGERLCEWWRLLQNSC